MIVVHVITGLNDGGAESTLYRLCSADSSNKHVVISLMGLGKYGAKLQAAGVDVFCLNLSRGKVSLMAIVSIWRVLRSVRPDVVQTWLYHANLYGGVAARLALIKKIYWGIHHSNLDPKVNKRSTLLVVKVCAFLSGVIPKGIISCSASAAEIHSDVGYKQNKFYTIPNGYDLKRFKRDSVARRVVRNELGVSRSELVFGMVARYDMQKDHNNLLSALSLLTMRGYDFVCLLVGHGMNESNTELVSKIKSKGLTTQVRLLGQRDDIASVMNALDIHVLSSLGEAFPNVLAEAMACGVPCVSTDVGDARLIIGKTGWIVPVGDPLALSTAIETALIELKDSAKWEGRMAQARQHILDNFSIQEMLSRYLRVWGGE